MSQVFTYSMSPNNCVKVDLWLRFTGDFNTQTTKLSFDGDGYIHHGNLEKVSYLF